MNHISVPVESIHIGERQRRDVPEAHIKELAQDILTSGLIHAITIDENFELCAGYCRLNAIRIITEPYYYAGELIPAGMIPCVVTHHKDEAALFRLELMENLRRKNLSPVDEARAVTALHHMLQAEHGPEWAKADSGKEIAKLRGLEISREASRDAVSDALIIHAMSNDPDVAKAKSRSEAFKIAKKKLEAQLMTSLGELTRVDSKTLHILQGDCVEVMKSLPDATFSGIVCDPPYGIDAHKFGEQTMQGGEHEYEDSRERAMDIVTHIIGEAARLCKPDAHLYIFFDLRNLAHLTDIARSYGFTPFATPLIWHKPGLGHAPQPGFFGRRYETIFFCQRGNRKLTKSRSDVFEFPSVKDKIHAAQKPVELLTELLSLSYFPGEHVLDPCAGSGSIFAAAKAAGLHATGIELSEKYYNICKVKIEELS